MLKLPDVTLVMIETLEHELARLAIQDCVDKVEFGDVLILTDKPELFVPLRCLPRFVAVPCWPDKLGWSKSSWFDVPPHVRTRQTLTIQWDSWVWDVDCWRDEYLDYDIIGAPWPWHPVRRVGNLGFGLRSARLTRYVREHRDKYPCISAADDDLLCRVYRPALEDAGFVWAPEKLARLFAFETGEPNMKTRHFGFHACGNFKYVLEHDALLHRARLMRESEYIGRKNSY
ncbi:MAG TPA: DUF5672 family protein, partial [Candidatus Cybelea sp.]|nr:DUF5672 family protein [Candidatus Cybelea sp.]